MIDCNLLAQESAGMGIVLDSTAIERFDRYAFMLVETNKKFNLTAIKSPDEIITKHFVDSLSLLKYVQVNEKAKVLDVGTGAGFPGIPLLIARPDLSVTMLDSTGKKLGFVNEVVEELGLNGTTVHARAEEYARTEARERFDLVASRAVAALNVLCEYCIPFVKPHGIFAAMKGAKAEEEIKQAENAVTTLGGKLLRTDSFTLSDGGERNIVVIGKPRTTPPKYPRPSAQISKKAL